MTCSAMFFDEQCDVSDGNALFKLLKLEIMLLLLLLSMRLFFRYRHRAINRNPTGQFTNFISSSFFVPKLIIKFKLFYWIMLLDKILFA